MPGGQGQPNVLYAKKSYEEHTSLRIEAQLGVLSLESSVGLIKLEAEVVAGVVLYAREYGVEADLVGNEKKVVEEVVVAVPEEGRVTRIHDREIVVEIDLNATAHNIDGLVGVFPLVNAFEGT